MARPSASLVDRRDPPSRPARMALRYEGGRFAPPPTAQRHGPRPRIPAGCGGARHHAAGHRRPPGAQPVAGRRTRHPVLFLTAKDSLDDRIAGLTAGGDDYVTKPFSLEELVARLRGLILRRSTAVTAETTDSVLRVGDLDARRGQLRGAPRRRGHRADRDRVRTAALPDAQPAPGAVAARKSSTGSGATTSAAARASSSSTSPICARRSMPGARP